MIATQKKQGLLTASLSTQLRQFFFSQEGIRDAIETGTPKQLEYLDKLLGRELQRRAETRKSRMVQHAGFPNIKSIDDYDFSHTRFPALMSKDDVLSLNFITQKRTLIFYGICGSGKTMFSVA